MRHWTVACLVILLGAAPTATWAGTSEEQQAALCRGDVLRLCMSSIPDRDRIVACMKAQRASLSSDCRTVFEDRGTPEPQRATLR